MNGLKDKTPLDLWRDPARRETAISNLMADLNVSRERALALLELEEPGF
jgi:hypothetical protein